MPILLIHLSSEQIAEDAQPYSIRLFGVCRDGHVVIQLTQQDATHHRRHQKQNHLYNLLLAARPDGHIDEALAQPHHQQTKQHLQNANRDAHDCVQPYAHHVTPYPQNVFHTSIDLTAKVGLFHR